MKTYLALLAIGSVVLATNVQAQAPKPHLINGKYYLGGDAVCANYNQTSESTIDCFNTYGVKTQTRGAMSQSAVDGWVDNQTRLDAKAAQYEQGQANMRAMAEALNRTTQSAQQFNSQMQGLAQSSTFQAPQVGPYGQPSGTSAYYCRDLTGTIVACRQVR